jgi:hypothetical protein
MSAQPINTEATATTTKVLTPYAVHKLVNAALAEQGLPPVKPQMIYNYVRNNLIPANHGRITQADAEKWVAKYVSRRIARLAEEAEVVSVVTTTEVEEAE